MSLIRRPGKWAPWTPTWVNYTPAAGTTTVQAAYRLDGKTLHLRCYVNYWGSGTFNTNHFGLTLPNGYTPNTEVTLSVKSYTAVNPVVDCIGFAYTGPGNSSLTVLFPISGTSPNLGLVTNGNIGGSRLGPASNFHLWGTMEIN